MVLNFTKTSALWVAEFIASSDFNLHIEGVKVRDLEVYQRGVGDGKYFIVTDAKENLSYASEVYDMDFAALVYPKHIKVVCRTEPSLAAITTDGEVTEIKAQSKEIEVTSNGTTNVTPDTGFAYLNSVKVKTNVAQSGGGSGCIRYFNIANLSSLSDQRMALGLGCLVKVSSDNQGVVIGSDYFIRDQLYIEYSIDDVVAIGVMPTIKFLVNGNIVGIEEPLAQLMGSGAIEITEEEFYNLNA